MRSTHRNRQFCFSFTVCWKMQIRFSANQKLRYSTTVSESAVQFYIAIDSCRRRGSVTQKYYEREDGNPAHCWERMIGSHVERTGIYIYSASSRTCRVLFMKTWGSAHSCLLVPNTGNKLDYDFCLSLFSLSLSLSLIVRACVALCSLILTIKKSFADIMLSFTWYTCIVIHLIFFLYERY